MNIATKITPDRADMIARRRSEIADLINALRKQDHWLSKAEYWAGVEQADWIETSPAYRHTVCMDRADECQPDILMAMYRFSEIDAIHDAWKECSE